MKIAVAVKVVPDDQDIQVAGDGSLDYSKAQPIVSLYDLNAIEGAVQLAEQAGDSQVFALTVGGAGIDDSKLKKGILARGVDELYMVAGSSTEDLDAHATALALKALVEEIGNIDVVFLGDGSADYYAQQVDVQLGAALGWQSVNAATAVEHKEGTFVIRRTLEQEIETVEAVVPAVIAVTPDIALPRIPGMKDILAAGKKPMHVTAAAEQISPVVQTVSVKAPKQMDRNQEILDAQDDGAIERFAAAIKASI